MSLAAPRFWYDDKAPFARLAALVLTPPAALWKLAGRLRRARATPYRSPLPVLCLGNVTAGGAGKTPAAIALVNLLRAHGLARRPFFLTRGYGGTLRGPVTADADAPHAALKFGDEAVLLARHAPTVVARDRPAGLVFAERAGADCVIADDGFQNPSFHKDFSLLVFDGASGLGNGLCIPAGPCRESLDDALPRAQAALMVGPDARALRPRLEGLPVFDAALKAFPQSPPGPCVAFSGMGRPEKFFASLKSCGYRVLAAFPFPDHHPYSAADMSDLLAQAARRRAPLITTEKDAVRLWEDARALVDVLPVAMAVNNETALAALIRAALEARA